MDWRKWILDTYCHDAITHIVQDIEADPEYRTREARAKRFKELTGQSRATYFRIVKRLKERGQLEPIKPLELPKTDLSNNHDHAMNMRQESVEECPEEPGDEEPGGQKVASVA